MSRFTAPFVASRSWAPPPVDHRAEEEVSRISRFLSYLGQVIARNLQGPRPYSASFSTATSAKFKVSMPEKVKNNDKDVELEMEEYDDEDEEDFEEAFGEKRGQSDRERHKKRLYRAFRKT